MKTTIAETYDFFTVMRARKKIGLEKDTEVFTLGIGGTAVGYLAVVILTETDIYDGYTDDFTSYLEKESNKEFYKKISVDFSNTKIKRRENKYGYLQYMDRTDSLYRCVIFGERVGAVLGDEIIAGRLCLRRRHPEVEKLDQHLFEFIENLRFDGSGKQLTALRGEGSIKRSASRTAPPATPPATSIKEILRAKGLSGAEAFQEAKKYIGKGCYGVFWRHEERHSNGFETAFAYAQDKRSGPYACGSGYSSMYVESAKDTALYHCEKRREKQHITKPCEILAVGNKIVWEPKASEKSGSYAVRPAVPINFDRDRPKIIKAIREYYDGPGESYDHPTSALGGTMGKIMTLTRLGSAGDQIEVKAEYTWVPNSVIHGMESPHDGKFVLKKEGGAYKVVKMWSKNFGWK